jgi:hypothetical protein
VRLEIFQADELEDRRMRRLQIDRRGPVVLHRRFPAGHTHAPFVARLQPGKAPLRMGRDQVVAVEHGEIEEIAGALHANRVKADIFRAGPAKAIPIKPGQRISAAAFQLGSENIRGHERIKAA